MYILLCGYPPFHDDDDKVLFKKIQNGNYSFHLEHWDNISEQAKDFIRCLLTLNPHKRITIDQALGHSWMSEGDDELDARDLDPTLEKLRKLQASRRMKKGMDTVLAANKIRHSSHANASKQSKLPHTVEARYVIGDKLGEGGYAVVHAARSIIDGSQVAIKIVKRQGLSDDDELSLRQEAELLQTLRHPNIVQAYDFFEASKQFYVVMELIAGGELFDRIVKKTFYNEKEARDLVYVLLSAIKFIHDKDIVHRYSFVFFFLSSIT